MKNPAQKKNSTALFIAVLLFTLLLVACKEKKQQHDYTLISDLAIKSLLVSENTDLQSLKALYKINEEALLAFDAKDEIKPPCCCPCPSSYGMCPCPDDDDWDLLGRNSWKITSVSLGGKPLITNPYPNDPEWTVFVAGKGILLRDGKSELIIKADFFGNGANEYRLPVEFKGGKVYLIE